MAGLAIAAGMTLLSIGLGLVVVLSLPCDYFVRDSGGGPPRHGAVLRFSLVLLKNMLGLLLLLAGVVMALPLIPGPGVFVMLIGVGLLDFPGRRAVERRLLGAPRILASVNRIRACFGRAALLPREKRQSMVDTGP